MEPLPERSAPYRQRVAVRTLVESVLLSGSLSRAATAARMRQGAEGHRALQGAEEPGVLNEAALTARFTKDEVTLILYGRADRLHGVERTGDKKRPYARVPDADVVVEEIKTCFSPVGEARLCPPQHWAQAGCYGAMLARALDLPALTLQLTYLNLGTGELERFTRVMTAEALFSDLDVLLARYFGLVCDALAHKRALCGELAAMPFPYPDYRPGQRGLSAQAYTAVREKRWLLAQSPTGTGKTMAVLFAGVKAISENLAERVFYLTARTTQQRAAVDALARMKLVHLRAVVLTARDKICAQGAPICAKEPCPRAEGYYDRLPAALDEFARTEGLLTAEAVRRLAARHLLCPFELSLDLSLLCDVIVGDYNYAFDPRVRLMRFFTQGKKKQALLVDEAHNLVDRARDMYSASLARKDAAELRRSLPKTARRGPLYKALTALLRAMDALRPEEPQAFQEKPEPLFAPAARAADLLLDPGAHAGADGALAQTLLFSLTAFLSVEKLYDERYVALYEGGRSSLVITLFCTDASKNLAASYKTCYGGVLFSATLTPFPFYKALLGVPESGAMLSLPSPFPPENLLVLTRRVPMRYMAREASLPEVAESVAAMAESREDGNFLVFLPSYQYLAAFCEALAARLPHARILPQRREMDDAARAAFLAEFSPNPCGRTVGLAVLGGAFAEGIDLPADRLCGAAVAGVGVPQLCLARDTLKTAYEKSYASGYDYAYRFPGFCKVLQAAGRVIRTERDRGVLLLLDARYGSPEYAPLLPPHWRAVAARDAQEVSARCRRFWAATPPAGATDGS